MGDMRAALDRYAGEYSLTKEQVKALSQIDNRELRVLRSLDKLDFSESEHARLADAARRSSNTKELMKRVQGMKFSRGQLAGLERWGPGELDSFNRLASKLSRSSSLLIPIQNW